MDIALLEERIRILHAQVIGITNDYEELKINYEKKSMYKDWLSKGIKLGDERNSRLLHQIKHLTIDNVTLARQCSQQASINVTNNERIKQMNLNLLEKKKQLTFAHKIIREKDQIISRFAGSSSDEDTSD